MGKLTDRLWERMTEMYGAAWTNKFGPVPTKAWIESLESVNPLATKHGLQQCAKNNPYPPSLPEFGVYLRDYERQERQREEAVPQLPRIMGEEERKQARETIARASGSIGSSGQRRNLLRPGENMGDYSEALANSGLSVREFREARLAENGWSQEDEGRFLLHLSLLNLRSRYGPSDVDNFMGAA